MKQHEADALAALVEPRLEIHGERLLIRDPATDTNHTTSVVESYFFKVSWRCMSCCTFVAHGRRKHSGYTWSATTRDTIEVRAFSEGEARQALRLCFVHTSLRIAQAWRERPEEIRGFPGDSRLEIRKAVLLDERPKSWPKNPDRLETMENALESFLEAEAAHNTQDEFPFVHSDLSGFLGHDAYVPGYHRACIAQAWRGHSIAWGPTSWLRGAEEPPAPAEVTFYPGYHQPSQVRNLERAFVSVHRLKDRKSDFLVNDWIMDSGAFTQVSKHGDFTMSVKEYAAQIKRWSRCGNLVAACAQDFMCEPEMFEHTIDPETGERISDADLWALGEQRGWSIAEHQRWTVDRYIALRNELERLDCDVYILPVLQGYDPADYVRHIEMYEAAGLLERGAYVGVGSVCKRNANPAAIEDVLREIRYSRKDLQLHGFGLKITALQNPFVRQNLASCDSFAWSDAARREGRDRNAWTEAAAYAGKVDQLLAAA